VNDNESAESGGIQVLKQLHYPLEIMLVCVRWYVAYPLSLRNLKGMMAERANAGPCSIIRPAPMCYQASAGGWIGVPPLQAPGRQDLARRRNPFEDPEHMEVSLPRRRHD